MTISKIRNGPVIVILLLVLGKTITLVIEPLLPLVIAGLLGLAIFSFILHRRIR